MKKQSISYLYLIATYISLFAGTFSPLFGEDDDSTQVQNIYPTMGWIDPQDTGPITFYSVKGIYENINKSHFIQPELSDEKIGYEKAQVLVGYNRVFNCYEAASIELGYASTRLRWAENPYFSQKDFNEIDFIFNGATKRIENWYFRTQFQANIDSDHFYPDDYGLYYLTTWGRYSWNTPWCQDIGLNMGFIGRTGLEQTTAWPIVGIDVRLTERFKLNLVYPVDISAVYTWNENFSMLLATKFWNERHRTGRNEPLSKGIFQYRNTGVEFGLNYDYCQFLSANVHIGSTFDRGDLKILNSEGNASVHHKFKGALYWGGNVVVRF